MNTLVLEKPTTEELFEKLYQIKGKAEIINGEIVEMPPTGFEPGRTSYRITSKLMDYEEKARRGFAVPDNVAFRVNLPNRKSFSPDSSFFTGKSSGMKFLEGAPIFAVEVRSENDYGKKAEKAIADKRADYFAAGTEIVWDVDLLSDDVIKSFHRESSDNPKIFRRGAIADAEPALPNWEMPVDELFE